MRDASTKISEAKSAANAAASNFSNPAFYTERMKTALVDMADAIAIIDANQRELSDRLKKLGV